MTKAPILKNLFTFFLFYVLTVTSFFPLHIHASNSKPEKTNSVYQDEFKTYFNMPFDGIDQAKRYRSEESYPINWYGAFDPLKHVVEVEMTVAEEKLKDFMKSAAERIETSRRYQDLLEEIFFRSAMMFRLAHNGYSTAYLKEFEQIISKFAELDDELKQIGLNLELRRSEVDRVIEGSLLAGIDQLNSRTSNVSPAIKEVLSTIVDFLNRSRFKSRVKDQANGEKPSERMVLRLILIAGLSLVSTLSIDFFQLDQILEVSKGKIILAAVTANLGLSRYLTNLVNPLRFKRSQNHIFRQMSNQCSIFLQQNDTSPRRNGGGK
ncbi:MAG: hypothetical protein IPJ71_04730 [Bdellovibrionales bacterium]|nr:hypothetical protein [Bdellovibrionales bacterium]